MENLTFNGTFSYLESNGYVFSNTHQNYCKKLSVDCKIYVDKYSREVTLCQFDELSELVAKTYCQQSLFSEGIFSDEDDIPTTVTFMYNEITEGVRLTTPLGLMDMEKKERNTMLDDGWRWCDIRVKYMDISIKERLVLRDCKR